jgi:hypothetical protein
MVAQFSMLTLAPWLKSHGGGLGRISVIGLIMVLTRFPGKHIVTEDVTSETLEMSSK